MNILLLAAGKGQRFLDVGYEKNKPLIEVNGVQMWQLVLENLTKQLPHEWYIETYVATKEEYSITSTDHKIINLEGPQLGAAYSAVQAVELSKMNQDLPLMILNVDQLIFFDHGEIKELMLLMKRHDGFLFHFTEPNKENKWGRSIIGKSGLIEEIVEKTPVSEYAHTGHYFYKSTSDFLKYAKQMMKDGTKINNEFFLSPTYNLMIKDGKKIIPGFVDRFVGLGLPEDLEKYLLEG